MPARDDSERPAVELERRVHLRDTDASGYPYFGAFYDWMQEAETELFRSVGRSLDAVVGDDRNMPAVHSECDYRRPLQLDEPFIVRAVASEAGRSSLRIEYEFRDEEDQLVARGATVSAYVDGTGRPVELPAWIRRLAPEGGTDDVPEQLARLLDQASALFREAGGDTLLTSRLKLILAHLYDLLEAVDPATQLPHFSAIASRPSTGSRGPDRETTATQGGENTGAVENLASG